MTKTIKLHGSTLWLGNEGLLYASSKKDFRKVYKKQEKEILFIIRRHIFSSVQ
jgi:hypothetical protein